MSVCVGQSGNLRSVSPRSQALGPFLSAQLPSAPFLPCGSRWSSKSGEEAVHLKQRQGLKVKAEKHVMGEHCDS